MTRRIPRAGCGVLAVCLLAATGSVAGGERAHIVRDGESFSSIAKRYYGSFEPGELLMLYNDRSSTVVRVGETLRVPYCENHRVQAGDSWSAMAKRYVGKASLYPVLAALNGHVAERPLQVGTRIVVPVSLPYRLQRGDTLAMLAERFYGDREVASILATYNGIEDPRRLAVGETVRIPLVSLQLKQARAQNEPAKHTGRTPSAAVPQHSPEPERRFRGDIRAAREAYVVGDYERAREMLESMRKRVVSSESDEDKKELWQLLSFVYVAFGLQQEACVAYRSLTSLSPNPELAPDLVSPKIRDAVSRCDKS